MENRYIWVLGGAGSIGSEIVRQLASKNHILVIDIDETRLFDLVEELRLDGFDVKGKTADIRDKNIFEMGKNEYYPELIFQCAARKHVSPMEETPMEAVSVNIEGTFNAIEFAKKCGAKLVNISTDKVVNAECIMGATKKVAELMVKNAGYTSVRFGNVMGSRGSVIPIWQKQIDEGRPLTITDSRMMRYMMSIPEAVSLVIEVAQMEDVDGKVVILDMGQPVNILSLAEEVLNKAQSTVGTKIIGSRPGEMFTEMLMTEEEEKRAVKHDKFWII